MAPLTPLMLALLPSSPKAAAQTHFFPKGAVSDFEANWFGEALTRMEEQALPESPPNVKIPASSRTVAPFI